MFGHDRLLFEVDSEARGLLRYLPENGKDYATQRWSRFSRVLAGNRPGREGAIEAGRPASGGGSASRAKLNSPVEVWETRVGLFRPLFFV